MNTQNTLKVKYLKKVITSKGYNESRADTMNNHIQHWKDTKNRATTVKGREFCDEMIRMYLKRYTFYVNS